MIAEDLECTDIQTGQIPLSDSGDVGMIFIAAEIESVINEVMVRHTDLDVAVMVTWLNFREKLNNPDGKQGSFRIRLIRKRQ